MTTRTSALTGDSRTMKILYGIIVLILLCMMFALVVAATKGMWIDYAAAVGLIYPILNIIAAIRGYDTVHCWLFGHKVDPNTDPAVLYCQWCNQRTADGDES